MRAMLDDRNTGDLSVSHERGARHAALARPVRAGAGRRYWCTNRYDDKGAALVAQAVQAGRRSDSGQASRAPGSPLTGSWPAFSEWAHSGSPAATRALHLSARGTLPGGQSIRFGVLLAALLVEVAAVHVVDDDDGEVLDLQLADGLGAQVLVGDDLGCLTMRLESSAPAPPMAAK